MKIRATAAIMECLLEQEVDTIFGYPGGTILNLYDELYRYRDRFRHILTAHEQGASHAADGYARATGKVGVCFATSGPGATNLTTGIATAYLDSSPVVFITCNVGESFLGKDAFQEVDITGIAMPITKATFLVRDPQAIPDVMRQAFAVAATGRPGPVLIDILKNVTAADQMVDYEFVPWTENRGCGSIRALSSDRLKKPEPDHQDVDTLLEMIAAAERPGPPGVPGVRRKDGRPCGDHRHGRRRVPRQSPPYHRHDRDARLRGLQCGLRRVRPPYRRGLPVLRPGGPESRQLRQPRQSRADRRGSGGD